ncbi:uncharacterized protein LOC134302820 [Trichomycterus rosablanca]|uniref:uncharacterized protein LOC134302820 n=1 Tax=Trichomycterus rosablanca TaxID=2290929 RepID=UPI002F35A984
MTDSVPSISNMRTAVYIATCAEPDQFSCDVQNVKWKYTTHNTPVHMHMMENVPDGAMLPVAGLHEAGHEERSRSLLIQRHPASIQTKDRHPNCTCSNSEAIRALQYEVSQLKRLLEESLRPLAHLANLNTRERRVCARPSSSRQNRSSSSRCLNMDFQKVEDWISTDVESSRSKASLENLSVDTYQSRGGYSHRRSSNADVRPASRHSEASRAITGPIMHGNSTNLGLTFHRNPAGTNTEYIRSCFSLPSGFKVKDRQSEPEGTRRRSTQSDSALLQSDVYSDCAATLPISPHRSRQRTQRHRASKEEAINSTLDKALEAVSLMKQTTDRMAKTLSEDLTKARIYRKLHSQHLSERKKT